jgi:hypothetical protein
VIPPAQLEILHSFMCHGVHDLQVKKKPRLFWVAAIAPLLSVIISTALVYLTRADKHGVQIVSFTSDLTTKFSKNNS